MMNILNSRRPSRYAKQKEEGQAFGILQEIIYLGAQYVRPIGVLRFQSSPVLHERDKVLQYLLTTPP